MYRYKVGIGSTPTQLVRSLLLVLILVYTRSTLVHLRKFTLGMDFQSCIIERHGSVSVHYVGQGKSELGRVSQVMHQHNG